MIRFASAFMIVYFIISILFIAYGSLVLYYWWGWKSIPVVNAAGSTPTTFISVIIPARNEEKNIGALLNALERQEYPRHLFEIIVVDDHSTDGTAEAVRRSSQVKLLSLTGDVINSYKKKAIETGIDAAAGSLIVATDADCIPGPHWLAVMAAYKEETNAVFVAAPVVMQSSRSVLSIFQSLDFLVLQGITGAGVEKQGLSLCNGANLGYDRSAFYEVDGFSGIDQLASGDDMLLMQKISTRYPGRIHYLKSSEAIVRTETQPTWKDFLNQRIRWASKAAYYRDKRITAVLLLVYLFNLSFPALFICGWWQPGCWLLLGILWIAKTCVEWPLVSASAAFFGQQRLMKFFFFFQPLHILYTVLSGLLGQFGAYEWKGRRVR